MAGLVCGVIPLVLRMSMMALRSLETNLSVLAACFSCWVDCSARTIRCLVSGGVGADLSGGPLGFGSSGVSLGSVCGKPFAGLSIPASMSRDPGKWPLAFMKSMTASTGMAMSMAESIQAANWLFCAQA